jgi:hypothetical protein
LHHLGDGHLKIFLSDVDSPFTQSVHTSLCTNTLSKIRKDVIIIWSTVIKSKVNSSAKVSGSRLCSSSKHDTIKQSCGPVKSICYIDTQPIYRCGMLEGRKKPIKK